MLMATKLDGVSRGPLEVTQPFNHVVLANYLKNEKHISSIPMLLSTNLGSMGLYQEVLPPMKSHDHLITWY